MTRSLALMLSMVLLFSLLTVPTLVQVTAEPTPTTTLPLTTTSTTWVLTGPDGINPDYTSTAPWTTTTTEWGCISTPAPTVTTTGTTSPPVPANSEIDLLTDADINAYNTISVLSYPTKEYGMCADCYTNNGAYLYITPTNGGPWDASTARYLHMTVRTNMPFDIRLIDPVLNDVDATAEWFAATAGTDYIIPAGGYRMVIDLTACYAAMNGHAPVTYDLWNVVFYLRAAGSISVGHIALSNSAVCDEPIPNIQTTTKPSFPWNDTTNTTLPTTTTTNSPCVDFVDPDGFCDLCGRPMPGVTTTTTQEIGCNSTPPPTTTTTIILTGPDGTQSTTLPPTTTDTEEETTWPTTTTSTAPIYTSGQPISTRPTEFVTTIAPDGLIRGDMNCDFTLDMTDAFALYKAVSTGDFSEIAVLRLADLNDDGIYDMTDAFALYRTVSGD